MTCARLCDTPPSPHLPESTSHAAAGTHVPPSAMTASLGALLRSRQAELLHLPVQHRTLHPQSGRGPLRPAHYPAGLAEGAEDVFPLGIGQRDSLDSRSHTASVDVIDACKGTPMIPRNGYFPQCLTATSAWQPVRSSWRPGQLYQVIHSRRFTISRFRLPPLSSPPG